MVAPVRTEVRTAPPFPFCISNWLQQKVPAALHFGCREKFLHGGQTPSAQREPSAISSRIGAYRHYHARSSVTQKGGGLGGPQPAERGQGANASATSGSGVWPDISPPPPTYLWMRDNDGRFARDQCEPSTCTRPTAVASSEEISQGRLLRAAPSTSEEEIWGRRGTLDSSPPIPVLKPSPHTWGARKGGRPLRAVLLASE